MRDQISVNTHMPILRLLRLLGLLVLLGLTGCSAIAGKWMGKRIAKKLGNRTGQAKVVGVIEMVNPEQSYVLINCEQRLNLPAGTEIVAQNADGTKATLKVTPEHKGNYITADIKDGMPRVSDIVLYQLKPGDQPPPTGTATGAVADPASGPAVPLVPIMQADVIPPLDAPFQPLAPIRPLAPQPALPQVPPPQSAPVPAPISEPEADPSALPPVAR